MTTVCHNGRRFLYVHHEHMIMKDALNLERAGYFRSKVSSDVADIPLNYGEHTISEIIFVPPIVSYAKNVIGMITTDDVMYVTRHIYE